MGDAHVFLDWNGPQILRAAQECIDIASKRGAEQVETDMKRYCPVLKNDEYTSFAADSFGFGGYSHSGKVPGELRDAIKTIPSKYADGSYVVGVFDRSASGDWDETLGARAVFVEFGHAGPGKGKNKASHWKAGAKVTKPQPFTRKARNAGKRKIPKIFAEEITRWLAKNETTP